MIFYYKYARNHFVTVGNFLIALDYEINKAKNLYGTGLVTMATSKHHTQKDGVRE